MEKDRYAPGEPCWADCDTDVEKASAFYKGLFGWETRSYGDDSGYKIAALRSRDVAGISSPQAPGTPHWSVYFRVDSVTHATDRASDRGAEVISGPIDVADAGSMSVLRDPQGAQFCLWQPGQHKGFGLVDEPGSYCWAELITSDTDAAADFYGHLFGWEARDGDDPDMPYTEFQLGVTPVAGMLPRPEMMPAEMPNCWGVYFSVDDCDDAVASIASLGGSTIVPPTDVPPGRFSTCVDAAGAVFSVIALGPTAF